MKRFIFPIDAVQARWIFSPIRERLDVIQLLMKSVKVMLLNLPLDKSMEVGKIVLVVSKMSRLFFVSDEKIFSIYFPFFVDTHSSDLVFTTPHYGDIDNRATSLILEIIQEKESMLSPDFLRFSDHLIDVCCQDESVWALLRELLMHEDGYLRYDNDLIRSSDFLHPRHHLDIFYSSGSTFKVGLKDGIEVDGFTDILDLTTNPFYLLPADSEH